MNNKAFLDCLADAFQTYLKTGARSNKKLVILHSFIARALLAKLSEFGGGYNIKSLGVGDGKEADIFGRYLNKKVDLTIYKNDRVVAGVAVKFVMSNYSQNSNNYFENMLGETANIRAARIPYYHILILTNGAPYFERDGKISKTEKITAGNLHKYQVLAGDDPQQFMHTPDRTLLYLVKVKRDESLVMGNKAQFTESLTGISQFETCTLDGVRFADGVILNDFEKFIEKIAHHIASQ
ncbi:MAG: hypothetical protein LBM73_01375 [Candidatus Nomurabacteria bacterium]|jgi:hypothetical protein|nr:hypothetical protein [Candidatus Nomurabacteria bacterium]